jgi:DNA invertase Pin-like site-specific DNA recombinase
MIYGYARVSTRGQAAEGNSLEAQERVLAEHGAKKIFKDSFTGTTTDRPELDKLLERITSGDTLIVTKLDRIARSLSQGNDLITSLINRGVTVNILNLGLMDNTPSSKLIRNIFLAFSEFERDMIVERTQEGRRISGNLGGRPRKYSKTQLDHAMNLLSDHSYHQVEAMTGISKSTLIRESNRRKQTSAIC